MGAVHTAVGEEGGVEEQGEGRVTEAGGMCRKDEGGDPQCGVKTVFRERQRDYRDVSK